jgi:release factor glutamine methyltransferase
VRFDLIVSNPPYLTDAEWTEAQPEVSAWEPRQALTSPDAGCADLERLIADARPRLNAGGWLALETGIAQHERLTGRLSAAGYAQIEGLADLAGRPRFLLARG